jgi:hypothetical protein
MAVYLDKQDVAAIAQSKEFKKEKRGKGHSIAAWTMTYLVFIFIAIVIVIAVDAKNKGVGLSPLGIAMIGCAAVCALGVFAHDYYLSIPERKRKKVYLDYFKKNSKIHPEYPLTLPDVKAISLQRNFAVPPLKSSTRRSLIALFATGGVLVIGSGIMVSLDVPASLVPCAIGVVLLYVFTRISKRANAPLREKRAEFVTNWEKTGDIPPRWEVKLMDSRLDKG